MARILTTIPLYNKKPTIARAIHSVLGQSTDCDLLVIDDGSTDASLKVVKEIESERITLLTQTNHGVSATRNRGIDHALKNHYDFIAFLDADDYWLPEHLSTLTKLMQTFPAAGVAGTNYKYKASETNFTPTAFSGDTSNQQLLTDYFTFTHLNSPLSSSNMLLRVHIDMLRYDENITHGEDTDFNIRLGLNSIIAFSNKVTAVIDLDLQARSGKVEIENRRYMNLDKYETYCKNYSGLKKFLDLNRFALALDYLLANQSEIATTVLEKIDPENLSKKQRFLLSLNGNQLRRLKNIQSFLNKRGLRWRTGS